MHTETNVHANRQAYIDKGNKKGRTMSMDKNLHQNSYNTATVKT